MKENRGFTLVEMMIVVATISLLAMIAIPHFMRTRKATQTTAFIQQLRVATDAFTMYNLYNGTYPPDRIPGEVPPGMEDHLRRIRWDQPTPIGGQWDWDYRQFGFTAGVSVYMPNRSTLDMQDISRRIDDGSLYTGRFRIRTDGYIFIIEY